MTLSGIKKCGLLILLGLSFNTSLAQTYLFYLHGKIVENQGAKAVDQVNGYGSYEYYAILDSLKKDGNTVLGDLRPKDTEVKTYAVKIKNQIDSLLNLGIKAQHITVIGASKGALIAMYVSTYLKNSSVNFVFMAACYGASVEPDLNCYGNILSIYEESDAAGSCTALKSHSNGMAHYKEIQLHTGKRHGFLFKPLPEWIKPCLKWAKGNYE